MSKWIKCSERIPDISTEIIVACKGYGGKVVVSSVWVAKYGHAKTEKGRRIQFHRNGRIYCELEEIIAWMPLPEPPEE